MNAIFGSLLSLFGVLLGIQELLTDGYHQLWAPALLLAIGPFMLLRNRSQDDDDPPEHRRTDRCTTCRGAGTVYSQEWNDWRRPGPVHTIRELCPACQGSTSPTGAGAS